MAKPPSWNEIRSAASGFAARWADETNEKAEAQTFWNEFLGIFGIDRRRVAVFEKRAQRTSTAGGGFIDIFWPGTLIAEHKSAGKSLEEAEQQAIDYLESIDVDDFPGLIITSDFATLRIRDLGGDNEPYTFPLAKLPEEIDRLGHLAGYKKREFSGGAEEAANVKAAKLMGRLYEELSRNGYEGHDASILLVRLLFLMFGDDTGMWEKGLFAEFIDARTTPDGSDLGAQLAHLFQVLDKEEKSRPAAIDELLARFPYVNGHLFAERIDIPAFDPRMRDELVTATEFDWGKISPAVFGSLFQAIKSKEARRELGEHYTTEANIMKALGPLFLDDLWERFETAKNNAAKLERLHEDIATIRVLDPACGCGNFLVIAYRHLRRLELEILKRRRDLAGDRQLVLDVDSMTKIRIDHFFGIEIEEWPARIAETAMFLVDQQANHELALEFGRAPDRLPITIAPVIHNGDALLMPWADVMPLEGTVYLVGNPPFIGTRLKSEAQKANQEVVWNGLPRSGTVDFVANWFLLAARAIEHSQVRAAFVATNSITQGEQAALLWGEVARHGVEIEFAHRTFGWSSEAPGAAAVHVVVIGLCRKGASRPKRLFDYAGAKGELVEIPASRINAYLIDGPEVLVQARNEPLRPGIPLMISGNKPRDGGYLSDISDEEATRIRSVDPIASKFLRRIWGAQEHLHGEVRWCLWLTQASPAEIKSSPELSKRVGQVLAERTGAKSDKGKAADRPALFASICQPDTDYLLVPSVSSETRRYIPVGYYTADDIATNAVFLIPSDDTAIFGLLSSRMFLEWTALVSSRMKSDFQISVTAVYNTFPFPSFVDQTKVDRVRAIAVEVLECRRSHQGSSLADLYDPVSMPVDLRRCHDKLDVAVDSLYGDKKITTSADRQILLLSLYAELTADLFTGEKPKKSRKKKS
jgi:hypothetical protein